MRLWYPGDERLADQLFGKLEFRKFSAFFLTMAYFIISWETAWYTVIIGLCAGCLMASTAEHSFYEKLELDFLKKLERFISDFRFAYQGLKRVEEALEEAIYQGDYQMGLLGARLLEALEEKKEVRLPHELFNLFSVLLSMHLFYGEDQEEAADFLENVSFIKEETGKEYLQRKRLAYSFMGLFPVTAAAFLFIKPMKVWAVASVEGIEAYYNGTAGRGLTLFAALSITIVWYLLLKIRFYLQERRKGPSHVLEGMEAIRFLCIFRMNRNQRKYQKLHRMLLYVGSRESCMEFMIRQTLCGLTGFLAAGFLMLSVTGDYFLLAGLLGGSIGYVFPYLDILICRILMDSKKEEEILRFQTILIYLRGHRDMSVEVMILWMERTALFFKEVLEGAAGRAEAMGMQVFEEMEQEAAYPPFTRLVEAFKSCDALTIIEVFRDLEAERHYYTQKTTQEKAAREKNAEILGRYAAFLPAFMVVLCKLVIPFVLEGMVLLNGFSQSIGSL